MRSSALCFDYLLGLQQSFVVARLALSGIVDCDIGLLKLMKMSESYIDGSGSISPSQSAEQTTDEEDNAVLNLELGAPYQNEPLAVDDGSWSFPYLSH